MSRALLLLVLLVGGGEVAIIEKPRMASFKVILVAICRNLHLCAKSNLHKILG